MILAKRVRIQLVVFITVALVAGVTMALVYVRLPDLLFGVGHYEVRLELPSSAGLYERANVTYRGAEIGQVRSVGLTATGVEAVLSLRSDVKVPSDLNAQVHSQSAIGEQYVALLPKVGDARPLKQGDVIPASQTSVPPDINSLLDATNRGLQAIPRDNLKTAVDEAAVAVGGLGPDLSRLVQGSTRLAIDARKNLDALTNLIDNSAPILNTQTTTADSIDAWANHLATVTGELQRNDHAVAGVLQNGGGAADAARSLFDRVKPSLPVLLANLVNVGNVAVAYRADLEQILVLLPQGAATQQAITVANKDTRQPYKGSFLSFNLNLNLPPTCNTGFLPTQQQRVASDVDYPARPDGDIYCRVPQDSVFNVRGARNLPCETVPGKRAPTVAMCESNQEYEPLNDGFNWKGDPNATLSGQPVPQNAPSAGAPTHSASPPNVSLPSAPPSGASPPPPIAFAKYDPATGTYLGPDGKQYTQANLAKTQQEKTWQSMVIPPPK